MMSTTTHKFGYILLLVFTGCNFQDSSAMESKKISNSILNLLLRKPNRPETRTTLSPKNIKCPKCSCGVPNVNSRIVGGQETLENQYPWMAMLRYGGQFYCGGALINDQYVLTAAHCVFKIPVYGISVRLLTHNRVNAGNKTVDREVEEIIQHPSYYFNNDTYLNDIALLKLDKKVELDNKGLKPVCLPCGSLNLAGEKGLVTGWGATSESGPTAENLLQVEITILSNEECSKKMKPIVSDMLCAGEVVGEKDACQGDSGGPLHILRNNKYYEAGIVSFGDGCAKPDTPGIYTKVTRFYSWIKQNTKDACYCS